ncbi:MAG: transglutaminaseTgpA domain-containing protein [Planctomycetia bacterium]|nr:transglutaminaseTgpA domain-containing protein [Planctomycetia bacterium]
MKKALSVFLAISAILATVMLQLGDSRESAAFISVFSFFAILTGLFVTDLTGLFSLSNAWSNFIIILVVVMHLGGVTSAPTEFLAYSIANILVYIQIILFFKKKDLRTCYHLIILSLILTVVGCVSPVPFVFGVILVFYVLFMVCVATTLQLVEEQKYYENHAFAKPAFGKDTSGVRHRKGHLARLALKTLVTAPLYVLFGFHDESQDTPAASPYPDEWNTYSSWETEAIHGMTPAAASRIKEKDHDDEGLLAESSSRVQNTFFDRMVSFAREQLNLLLGGGSRRKRSTDSTMRWGDQTFGSWESVDSVSRVSPHEKISQRQLPGAQGLGKRFPLAHMSPIFSGSSRGGNESPFTRELFVRLLGGTGAAFLVGIVVFLVFPRFSEIRFIGMDVGHDRWHSSSRPVNNFVGFNENMKLGQLGPTGENHELVMSLNLVDPESGTAAKLASGTPLYLRGVTLVTYTNGLWERLPIGFAAGGDTLQGPMGMSYSDYGIGYYYDEYDPEGHYYEDWFNDYPFDRMPGLRPSMLFPNAVRYDNPRRRDQDPFFPLNSDPVAWQTFDDPLPEVTFESDFNRNRQNRSQNSIIQKGVSIRPGESFESNIYDSRNPIVRQEIELVPLSTPVIFSIWPFFRIDRQGSNGFFEGDWYVRPGNEVDRTSTFHLYTNSLSEQGQNELTPNQERVAPNMALFKRIDLTRLAKLAALARQWDDESGLPKSDVISRAKYLEGKLRDSGDFSYTRGYVMRDRKLDPLEDFVANHPEGHCEYFAGALAMMLRAVDIPSRVVIGFLTIKNNPRTMVVQSDAHSWVEAYVPADSLKGTQSSVRLPEPDKLKSLWWRDGGWLRLDATPESSDPYMTKVAKSWQSWRGRVWNSWNSCVMNFDPSNQEALIYKPLRELYETVMDTVIKPAFWKSLALDFMHKIRNFVRGVREGNWDTLEFFRIAIPLAILLFGLASVAAYIRRLLKKSKENRLLNLSRTGGFLVCYVRMTRFFRKLGITRLPSETPREFFTRSLTDARFDSWLATAGESTPNLSIERKRQIFAELVRRIISIYYEIRFGQLPANQSEIHKLEQYLKNLKIME